MVSPQQKAVCVCVLYWELKSMIKKRHYHLEHGVQAHGRQSTKHSEQFNDTGNAVHKTGAGWTSIGADTNNRVCKAF